MVKRQRNETNCDSKQSKSKDKNEEKDNKTPKKSKPITDGKSREQSTSSKTADMNNNNKMNNKKSSSSSSKGGGLDEIDSLFAHKKQSDQKLQQQIQNEKQIAKEERARRKQARLEEEAEEMALRGGATGVSGVSASAAATTAVGKRKGDASAPQALQAKAKKLSSLTYSRSDILELNQSDKKEAKDVWASDGLGGIFNGEGYTGRRDDGGHRVFKAHLMNKKDFGKTKDCPFDCDCCFIWLNSSFCYDEENNYDIMREIYIFFFSDFRSSITSNVDKVLKPTIFYLWLLK